MFYLFAVCCLGCVGCVCGGFGGCLVVVFGILVVLVLGFCGCLLFLVLFEFGFYLVDLRLLI